MRKMGVREETRGKVIRDRREHALQFCLFPRIQLRWWRGVRETVFLFPLVFTPSPSLSSLASRKMETTTSAVPLKRSWNGAAEDEGAETRLGGAWWRDAARRGAASSRGVVNSRMNGTGWARERGLGSREAHPVRAYSISLLVVRMHWISGEGLRLLGRLVRRGGAHSTLPNAGSMNEGELRMRFRIEASHRAGTCINRW